MLKEVKYIGLIYLHSTVVLLKLYGQDDIFSIELYLHSTVVLLKLHLIHYVSLFELYLHSTVVLLKLKLSIFQGA